MYSSRWTDEQSVWAQQAYARALVRSRSFNHSDPNGNSWLSFASCCGTTGQLPLAGLTAVSRHRLSKHAGHPGHHGEEVGLCPPDSVGFFQLSIKPPKFKGLEHPKMTV